jgi:hypothetical protein
MQERFNAVGGYPAKMFRVPLETEALLVAGNLVKPARETRGVGRIVEGGARGKSEAMSDEGTTRTLLEESDGVGVDAVLETDAISSALPEHLRSDFIKVAVFFEKGSAESEKPWIAIDGKTNSQRRHGINLDYGRNRHASRRSRRQAYGQ